MRVIPFNVVFLLLLACSLQVKEEYALRLSVSPRDPATSIRLTTSRLSAAAADRRPRASAAHDRPTRTPGLAPRALATFRTIWTMRTPALESTRIASVTSLRRA